MRDLGPASRPPSMIRVIGVGVLGAVLSLCPAGAPADPVVARATHADDLQLDTPTLLMLSAMRPPSLLTSRTSRPRASRMSWTGIQ